MLDPMRQYYSLLARGRPCLDGEHTIRMRPLCGCLGMAQRTYDMFRHANAHNYTNGQQVWGASGLAARALQMSWLPIGVLQSSGCWCAFEFCRRQAFFASELFRIYNFQHMFNEHNHQSTLIAHILKACTLIQRSIAQPSDFTQPAAHMRKQHTAPLPVAPQCMDMLSHAHLMYVLRSNSSTPLPGHILFIGYRRAHARKPRPPRCRPVHARAGTPQATCICSVMQMRNFDFATINDLVIGEGEPSIYDVTFALAIPDPATTSHTTPAAMALPQLLVTCAVASQGAMSRVLSLP